MDLPDVDERIYHEFGSNLRYRVDKPHEWNVEGYKGSRRFRSRRWTRQCIREMKPEDLEHLESYINLQLKLDLEVQRLAAFIHKRRALQASLDKSSKKKLPKDEVKAEVAAIQKQLEDLKIETQPARDVIWHTSCSIFLSLAEFPAGDLKDRLAEPHADNNWAFLHCKARGGCCRYDCKCCSKPREGLDIQGVGHCTSACFCCEERRGTHIDTSNGDPQGMEMKVSKLGESRECVGLVDVFIGLVKTGYAPLPKPKPTHWWMAGYDPIPRIMRGFR
ncbi:uncharacterized protein KD926_000628 [Aspergillus affinis]|uniref:uncharacterized protein n=1 Tax=Aspergillus affinis TaxID=1070780 RepID=UPI0022FF431C|nr:uncharacterized protein KD926_000628 [Aspergillus affinis]KAI9037341.1 hypothetical protein KD926_000628 [Aspergillus affinis]